ncbi:hypothetical protein [Chlamydiifrater phoenicopteri]|uniref:hypothetical protein n=1 Tax=Chlamydiifrater phoenicopteri TaxID=2681469 RepID=UPI001BD1ADD0|nr:hypothetical protein [Chlamydiifrater phoenicopteri]
MEKNNNDIIPLDSFTKRMLSYGVKQLISYAIELVEELKNNIEEYFQEETSKENRSKLIKSMIESLSSLYQEDKK